MRLALPMALRSTQGHRKLHVLSGSRRGCYLAQPEGAFLGMAIAIKYIRCR